MENSIVKANYVWYCDEDIEYDDYSKFKNISDLIHYDLPPNESRNIKYNFGDLVAFSDYRDSRTYIIGKEGKLIANPDFSAAGYLTIPYEITKYLDNAVNKYSEVEPSTIELKFDDKLILDNINTKSCKILEKWNWNITYDYNDHEIFVKFPNGKTNNFMVNNTSSSIIKKWYESSNLEQSKLKIFFEVKDELYDKYHQKYNFNDKPKIPSTWRLNHGSSGGGHKHMHRNYILEGPTIDKEKAIKSINKFFKEFDFNVTEY